MNNHETGENFNGDEKHLNSQDNVDSSSILSERDEKLKKAIDKWIHP